MAFAIAHAQWLWFFHTPYTKDWVLQNFIRLHTLAEGVIFFTSIATGTLPVL